jgi:hypothetical protein
MIGGSIVGGVVGTPFACGFERTGDVDEATPSKVAAVFAGVTSGIAVAFAIFLCFVYLSE